MIILRQILTLQLFFLYCFAQSAFRILLETDEDRLLVIFNRGLILMTEVGVLLLFFSLLVGGILQNRVD